MTYGHVERSQHTLFFLALYVNLWFALESLFYEEWCSSILGGLTFIYLVHDLSLPYLLKWDMKLHHYVAMILILYSQHFPWKDIRPFYQTELSTFFLSLRYLSIHKKWVELCFLPSFFYYRIWILLHTIIKHHHVYFYMYPIVWSCAWILQILNLYWCLLIVHKLYRKIRHS